MSQHPPGSAAPPGWHFQPAFGRWLWWNGARWVDPTAEALGPDVPPPPWAAPPTTAPYVAPAWGRPPAGIAAPEAQPYGSSFGTPPPGRVQPVGAPSQPYAWSGPWTPPEPIEAPGRWWPPLEPIGFPAALVSLAFLSVMFVLQLVVAEGDPIDPWIGLLALGVLGLSIAGMPAVALLCARKWGSAGAFRSIGFRVRAIDIGLALPTAIVMTVLMVVVNVLFAVFQAPTGSNLEDVAEGGRDTFQFLFLIVLSGLIAPVTEELIFRGALFRGLLDRMSLWPALLLQGAVFGAMHYTPGQGWGNVNLVVSLGVLGVGLGVVTKWTGRLGLAICAHAVFNLMQVGLLWLSLE